MYKCNHDSGYKYTSNLASDFITFQVWLQKANSPNARADTAAPIESSRYLVYHDTFHHDTVYYDTVDQDTVYHDSLFRFESTTQLIAIQFITLHVDDTGRPLTQDGNYLTLTLSTLRGCPNRLTPCSTSKPFPNPHDCLVLTCIICVLGYDKVKMMEKMCVGLK